MAPGGNRGWLLRLVIAFGCARGAVSTARSAVSFRALAMGADERAVGVIAAVYALLCAGVALPVPVWALGAMLTVLGFCRGVGRPLSMTTVVQAAPAEARSTALALRLTGNRLGRVAAPAAAGLATGLAGVAAPFLMLGVLLLVSSGVALRSPGRPGGASGRVTRERSRRAGLRRTSDI
ncbi:hypothetical protein GCM10010521_20400 [Streptomyces rameus]|uniref:MFS transporter n=1 Tax=Streptomyces rameus TaxID=68261 RepID=A0ABP6N2K3_9ACTN